MRSAYKTRTARRQAFLRAVIKGLLNTADQRLGGILSCLTQECNINPKQWRKVEYWLSLGVQFTIVMDDGGEFAKAPRDLAGRVVGYNERQPNVDIMRHIRAGGIPGLIPATMGLLNLDYDVDEDDVIDDAPMRAWWREGDFKRSAAVPSRSPGRYHKWLVLHKDFRNNFNTAHPRPELGPWEIRLQGAHTILWNLDAFVAAMSALKGSNFVTNADIDDLRPPEALRREKARVGARRRL